ncbi:hypothetical protein Tco_1015659 [Tanacetum coccineum]|uniref:Cyclic nucleotide-binding domain-containing protein n=1 Tax=Tanacetum coccineum TaxID=301880 RepID=A0ABQ5FM16_9ASTR
MLPLDVCSPSFEGTKELRYVRGGGGTIGGGDIGEFMYLLVDGDVGDLSLESMKDKEVATVDGVFEGAFGAFGLEMEALVDAMEVMVVDDE